VAGRTRHGVADGARRSTPSKCMGLLCMPAGKSGACVRAAKGAQGSWPGARRAIGSRCMQQGWAAGAQQAGIKDRGAVKPRFYSRAPL
jgi:hypothetical protein